MRKGVSAPAAILLWAGLCATGSQAVAETQQCLTRDEASSVVLVVLPEAFKAFGTACAQALPPTALLRQTSGPFIEKYQAEADTAWPMAKAGIAKMAGGDKTSPFLDSDLMRPMLSAMLAPAITKKLKTRDCPAIDHILTQFTPLPPRNLTEVIVSILELVQADDVKAGKKTDIPICTVAKP